VAVRPSSGLWLGYRSIRSFGRRIGQDLAEVPNINRREALVNGMYRIARVPDVGLRFVDRRTRAGEFCYNSHPRAMEAEVRQTNPFEELMPLLRRVFGELNEPLPLRCLSPFDQRMQIWMQRSGMNSAALRVETDGPSYKVNAGERHARFGQTAPLPHRDQPAIPHPVVSHFQGFLNLQNLVIGDLGFLLGWRPLESQPHARIGRNESTSHRLLHQSGENLQFRKCRIVGPRPHQVLGWARPECRIIGAKFVGHLRRRNDAAMLKVRRQCGPRVQVTRKRLGVRILLAQKTRNPRVESIRIIVPPELLLLERFLGDKLLHLSDRARGIDADPRGLRAPSSIRLLNPKPIIRTAAACVGGRHVTVAWCNKLSFVNDRSTL